MLQCDNTTLFTVYAKIKAKFYTECRNLMTARGQKVSSEVSDLLDHMLLCSNGPEIFSYF